MIKHLKKIQIKKPAWLRKPVGLNKQAVYRHRKTLAVLTCLCLIATAAYAGRIPVSGSADARVKKVTYHENDVYLLKGHYGYTTVVELDEKERIETISLGDSEAWQVVKPNRQNILFIKPLEQNAATNMTVITSRRIYSFELTAEKAPSESSPDLTFRLKFAYNDKINNNGVMTFNDKKDGPVSSVSPDQWNFEYAFTGDNALRPQRVFDDGKFTYFQFDSIGVMPAVFLVDDKGKESVVNSSVQGTNLVVHRVGPQFRLRDGDLATMIFNETWPQPTGKERGIVPVTVLKEKSTAKTATRKKRKPSGDSFFASFTPNNTPQYNK